LERHKALEENLDAQCTSLKWDEKLCNSQFVFEKTIFEEILFREVFP
jgi:hypothetical protein